MNFAETLSLIEQKTGAAVSLQACHSIFYRSERLRLNPGQYVHHTEFCRAHKAADNNKACSHNKARSLQIAALGRCFSGTCPFGVYETAFPVCMNGILYAVFYIGKSPTAREYGHFLVQWLKLELESVLTEEEMQGKNRESADYLSSCMRYLDVHYSENVALYDLADLLKVNVNYLGSVLKKVSGKTFRELLTERRLRESEVYLAFHRNWSISKIALICGFSDSNYFSAVFHKKYGVSPRLYREQHQGK